MIFTLTDAKDFCAPHVDNGLCSTDSRVVDVINESLQMLMNDDKLRKHTYQIMRMTTYNRCLPMPYNVEAALKVIDSTGTPANVFGMGYEFLDCGPGSLDCSCAGIGAVDLIDDGDGYPTFFPLPGPPLKICAFSTETSDIGKEIRVMGYDHLGQEINPTTPGEVIRIQKWQGGVEGEIDGNNLTLSTNRFAEITSVIKDETDGYITFMAYNQGNITTIDEDHFHLLTLDGDDTGTSSTDYDHSHTVTAGVVSSYAGDDYTDAHDHEIEEHYTFILSKYHPYETQPGYRRYRIAGTSCETEECLRLMVKMRYVPMKHDQDVLPIQNLVALKWMCKAIKRYDEDDIEGGVVFRQLAEAELARQTSAFEMGNHRIIDVQMEGYAPNAVSNML